MAGGKVLSKLNPAKKVVRHVQEKIEARSIAREEGLVVDNSPAFIAAKNEAIQRAYEAIGLQGEGYAKLRLTEQKAVDTGNLRNRVTHKVMNDGVYIGTNVEYASYVELGTSRMEERPYLRPAARDHTDEYKRMYEEALHGRR